MAMSDGSTATPVGEGPRPDRTADHPTPRPPANYAARRMLVSTIVITVVVAAGVFAWRAVSGGDGASADPLDGWGAIALVDRATGDVVLVDETGTELRRLDGVGRVTEVHTHGRHLALVGPTRIVLADTDDEIAPTTIEIERGSAVVPVETATTLHLLVGDPAGGNLLIVDVDDGTVIDVAAAAAPTVPKLFLETVRVSADGSTFAVADAANFQTIVVGDAIEGAAFLADQPVAVGERLIATSQVVNLQADIALVTIERRNEALVPTELPRGGLMVGDDLVMVSVDGNVFRIRKGDREANRLGTLPVPADATVSWTRPSLLGERLVVAGNTFLAIIDLEASTLFATTFPADVDVQPPRPGWRCLPVGGGDSYHSLVSLDSGEQLADLAGSVVTAVADDGCTVVAERSGVSSIVAADRFVELGRLRDVVLSPNGDAVVWTTTSGRTEIVPVSDEGELGEPLELPGAPTSLVVAFLPG